MDFALDMEVCCLRDPISKLENGLSNSLPNISISGVNSSWTTLKKNDRTILMIFHVMADIKTQVNVGTGPSGMLSR